MTEKQTITDEMTSVLEEIIEEPAKQPQKGELVTLLNDEELMIGNRQYKLVMDYREGFNPEKLGERYSEVLARYDYIVGDWGYEQLRLKGFFEKDNRKALPDQRIDMLEDYLYEYCNFGCAYFCDPTSWRQERKKYLPPTQEKANPKQSKSKYTTKRPYRRKA